MAQADSKNSISAPADASRRRFLAVAGAASAVAAGSLAAAAMPLPVPQGALDTELVQAAHGMEAADKAIDSLHDKFGDDADSRADYHALQRQRNDHIATLIVVPALSAVGVQAKAGALRLKRLIEDYEQHQQVAVSLADDIAERSLPMRPVIARQPDPVYAAIDAYEKAYAECRAACAETRQLYDRAIKVAGEAEVAIPDLRGPNAGGEAWALPVAFVRDGQSYVAARSVGFIEAYLPGEANEHLRQGFLKRLDEIREAQDATYGGIDPDKIIEGPAEAELNAVHDLIQTVPSTLPGLFALLSCLAKVHRSDHDMLSDQHPGLLIETLGQAAATLG
jgi:hypothetical protein